VSSGMGIFKAEVAPVIKPSQNFYIALCRDAADLLAVLEQTPETFEQNLDRLLKKGPMQ
jgi:hypothetical protein